MILGAPTTINSKALGEDIDLFLQNCPLLKQLAIFHSTLTYDVQLCGANLMLKHLEIFRCNGSSGTLSIENVQKLVEARIAHKGSLYDIQHFASAASCYRSQVQSLELIVSRPKYRSCFGLAGFLKCRT